ncbi:hypothetical protein LX77_00386 [Gelidibacter algens]|uniref:Uncharacterized protein n=1 Tax=Gelidibacter algens TaxID=49280 RepID=A0A1A7QTZ9_9FLAO|nr:hypothetical protein [Gelidibacter algens]OBX22012.1 hypothetical protein A9996_17455 [Gelidibacter algens]RAJ27812.1 hypothetical protein LX77_00386 [Gelidibacter algens]
MKKSKLHTIKGTGFEAPDSYFDSFDERLFKKLAAQKDMAAMKNSGYKVPETYFDSFDARLQARLKNEDQPKVRTLLSWRNTVYISGVAAALVVMLTVFFQSDDILSINQIETASIESYLNGENLNAYDIASFLSADDIVLDDFVTHTFTDESLENYLLNNTSIEDLINDK